MSASPQPEDKKTAFSILVLAALSIAAACDMAKRTVTQNHTQVRLAWPLRAPLGAVLQAPLGRPFSKQFPSPRPQLYEGHRPHAKEAQFSTNPQNGKPLISGSTPLNPEQCHGGKASSTVCLTAFVSTK